jgi:hypothetical protein
MGLRLTNATNSSDQRFAVFAKATTSPHVPGRWPQLVGSTRQMIVKPFNFILSLGAGLGAQPYEISQDQRDHKAPRAFRCPQEADMGPSSAKVSVESQLAAWAIVGCEHIVLSDQAKTATHRTPIAARTNP